MQKVVAVPKENPLKLPDNILTNSSNTANDYNLNIVSIKPWQTMLKRFFDIIAAAALLIFLSPFLLYIALRTRFSSAGAIIYRQQRVGYKGRLFYIYKFRSMYGDAEKNGPLLSFKHDKRITKWGRSMRKWKLDELPQLWNILKGEMSFVGPRPERKFYIEKINAHSQNFPVLLAVKPGLTSAGMVEFGYASNVREMISRMQYDLHYLKNFSLLSDFKIILSTLRIVVSGKGN